MNFAAELRTAREKAGLTIDQAAERAGVARRTWCYWEAGESQPPLAEDAVTQEKILAALKQQPAPAR